MSDRFAGRLGELAQQCDLVEELRIEGMMIGLELAVEGAPLVAQCLERGLLINCTQSTVLRLLPPLNLTPEQVDEGVDILSDLLRAYSP